MPSLSARVGRSLLWTALLLASVASRAADLPSAQAASESAGSGGLSVSDVAVLAGTCANCHGPGGRSPGGIPSLRGLPADHLLQRMLAFKAGQAADATVMTRLMKGYDEAQIRELARWFADDADAGGKGGR